SKFSLFDWPGLRSAVVNIDDPSGAQLLARLEGRNTVSFSLNAESGADIVAHDTHAGTHGLVFTLSRGEGSVQMLTRLIGLHNVSNLLLVAGVLQELGWSLSRTARTLPDLRPEIGRASCRERVEVGGGVVQLKEDGGGWTESR